MSNFRPATEKKIHLATSASSLASCELDPIPTRLVQICTVTMVNTNSESLPKKWYGATRYETCNNTASHQKQFIRFQYSEKFSPRFKFEFYLKIN